MSIDRHDLLSDEEPLFWAVWRAALLVLVGVVIGMTFAIGLQKPNISQCDQWYAHHPYQAQELMDQLRKQ